MKVKLEIEFDDATEFGTAVFEMIDSIYKAVAQNIDEEEQRDEPHVFMNGIRIPIVEGE